MRITPLIAGPVASVVAIAAVSAQFGPNDGSVPTRKRYRPEYTASGDLMLPKNFDEREHVGSPLPTAAKSIWLNFRE